MKFRLDPLSVSGASAIPPIAPVITGVSASGGASPLTTKGDIYTYSTANARLPVGGDGTVLSSDSTQATGLKWISSGGTGTVTTVSVVTANGVSGSVTNATTTPAITLILGAITPTTVNGLAISTTTGTLTVASAKTLTISNSLTLAGTDLTTMTFPGASDTVVTLVAVQALTHKDLSDATNTFPTFNQNTTGSAAKWTSARNLAGNSVDGSANVAFANKFVVQGTTDAGLSAAQFLGALGTGIVKNTTTTGVLTIAVAGDFPTLNQNTTGSAATWTTARSLAGNSVNGSADVPFANKFIVQGTTDTGLSSAQFMGALGTGIIKNTTTTGVFSIATAPDFPTLNQNTSGTAAGLSAVLVPASGGTGVANNNASTLTISGSFATTLTVSATTALTLPVSGTLATLAGAETLTNKILSDTFIGNGFQSQNALAENLILTASANYLYDNLLEIGASNALEIPATSTLEIESYIDQPYTNNTLRTAPDANNTFIVQSRTWQDITLPIASDYLTADVLEIGVGNTLEIPPTSTLEIAGYLGQGPRAVAAVNMQYGMVRNRQGGTTANATWQTAGTSNTNTAATSVFLQTGSIGTNATAGVDVAVTFPTAYSYAPLVFVTIQSANGSNQFCTVNNVTATGFNIRQLTGTTVETAVWLAIGQ